MDNRKIILAGTYNQYLYWCDQNGVSPHDRNLYYIYDRDQLRGLRFSADQVFKVGTFYERKDIDEIERELLHCFAREEFYQLEKENKE